MRKIVCIFVLLFVLTACSDIDYPPRGIETTAPPVVTASPSDRSDIEDKYKLKKYDLTVKPFNEERLIENGHLTMDNSRITISMDFNSPQHYRIGIEATGAGVVALSSKGETFGAFYVIRSDIDGDDGDEQEMYYMAPVYFPEGQTELTLTLLRGSVKITRVTAMDTLPISPERFNTSVTLNSPACAEAITVFEYLASQFGQRALTSQHCTVNTNAEIEAVYKSTGRYPAVRFVELEGVLQPDVIKSELKLIKKWHKKGGLVGIAWLPNSPGRTDEDFFQSIDAIAEALSALAEENIPVLFNPLPDAGSRLHWWGGGNAANAGEEYIKLWQLIYEQMTVEHGLDNIIWVWSGGNHKYYPGDNRVDIIGESAFSPATVDDDATQMGTEAVKLAYTNEYSPNALFRKPAMVSQSSALPSPDALARDNSAWLIWSLYKGNYVIDSKGDVLERVKAPLDRFYNHELTICLDNLPKFVFN